MDRFKREHWTCDVPPLRLIKQSPTTYYAVKMAVAIFSKETSALKLESVESHTGNVPDPLYHVIIISCELSPTQKKPGVKGFFCCVASSAMWAATSA